MYLVSLISVSFYFHLWRLTETSRLFFPCRQVSTMMGKMNLAAMLGVALALAGNVGEHWQESRTFTAVVARNDGVCWFLNLDGGRALGRAHFLFVFGNERFMARGATENRPGLVWDGIGDGWASARKLVISRASAPPESGCVFHVSFQHGHITLSPRECKQHPSTCLIGDTDVFLGGWNHFFCALSGVETR